MYSFTSKIAMKTSYLFTQNLCTTLNFRLLMDKNIENQTLETVSTIVQKKFGKPDFLSGKSIGN